jgi:predicted ATPase with chaperone activity
MTQSGFVFPQQRLTVNLAPADLPKDSNGFELPIALGILVASQQLPASAIEGIVFLGELSLGGQLQAVRASFALGLGFARSLEQRGLGAAYQSRPILCVPPASAAECAMAYDGPVWQAPDLRALCESLIDEQARPSLAYASVAYSKSEPIDGARYHAGSYGLKRQSTCQICGLRGCERRTSPLAGWAPRLWKNHAGSDDGIDHASAKRNHPA